MELQLLLVFIPAALSFTEDALEFRQIYLRYQDIHLDVAFETDDDAIAENSFTYCDVSPSRLNSHIHINWHKSYVLKSILLDKPAIALQCPLDSIGYMFIITSQ